MIKLILAVQLLFLSFATHSAQSATLPGIPEFIDEMVIKHQLKREDMESLFEHAEHKPAIIEAMSRPATFKPWPNYRATFVNQKRIKQGLEFWQDYRNTLRRAERTYGVPQEIIVAVIGVETIYGKNTGGYRVIDALTTLAFDYPRRAVFFRQELENYLLLAHEQQFNLLEIKGSYAGAMGIPQFMPSSYRNHAVDFNNNHKTDLLHEKTDSIGSVANYLKNYGWIEKEPVALIAQVDAEAELGNLKTQRTLAEWATASAVPSVPTNLDLPSRLVDYTLDTGKEYWFAFNNFEVITRYNNSDYYAMAVFQLAEELKAARKAQKTF